MSALSGPRRRVTDPAAFGRVAVLMGGWSAEREVSLMSGQGVLDALRSLGVDAHGVDATPERVLRLGEQGYARAFNILHGTGGEDGTVQAALVLQGIPCTGSGVAACALAMDKLRSKQLWRAAGLPVPEDRCLTSVREAHLAADAFGFPFIIKPSEEGSSVGISKVKHRSEVDAAWALAYGVGRTVMAERYIAAGPDGHEFTCSLVDGQALPLIRITPPGEFYDYHAKYISDDTRYDCPCGLDAALEAEMRAVSLAAFAALGASGWGRVDLLLDAQRHYYLLEANLVPGMTSHSLVPMAARALGASYAELCWAILETTLAPLSAEGANGV